MNPPRAYTEIDLGGANIFLPPPGAPKEGQNLNCKFKTFCFLDNSKLHIQVLLYLIFLYQTKLTEIFNGITRQKNRGKR